MAKRNTWNWLTQNQIKSKRNNKSIVMNQSAEKAWEFTIIFVSHLKLILSGLNLATYKFARRFFFVFFYLLGNWNRVILKRNTSIYYGTKQGVDLNVEFSDFQWIVKKNFQNIWPSCHPVQFPQTNRLVKYFNYLACKRAGRPSSGPCSPSPRLPWTDWSDSPPAVASQTPAFQRPGPGRRRAVTSPGRFPQHRCDPPGRPDPPAGGKLQNI